MASVFFQVGDQLIVIERTGVVLDIVCYNVNAHWGYPSFLDAPPRLFCDTDSRIKKSPRPDFGWGLFLFIISTPIPIRPKALKECYDSGRDWPRAGYLIVFDPAHHQATILGGKA
jgi:hypothetical protein